MVNVRPRICPGETPLAFQDKNGSSNPDQITRPRNNNKKKKRTHRIVDFAFSTDDRVKLKESEKKDMYLNIFRELKTPWNMKVTVIPIVIGVLGTVIK